MSAPGNFQAATERWHPERLWSLWDMQKVAGEALYHAIDMLSKIGSLLIEVRGSGEDDPLLPKGKEADEFFAAHLSKIIWLREGLAILGARLADKTASELEDSLKSGECTRRNLHCLCGEIGRRLKDEMAARVLLIIDERDADLYAQKEPLFGPDVEAKLPSAAEDISEAGKCLAVGRPTATVFHLMRVMEVTVKALGDKLGVTTIDKNNADLEWGIILSNMSSPIGKMSKGDAKEKWSDAMTLLVHAKIAWRNPTMHPRQTHTEEHAKEIFAATKAFMRSAALLI